MRLTRGRPAVVAALVVALGAGCSAPTPSGDAASPSSTSSPGTTVRPGTTAAGPPATDDVAGTSPVERIGEDEAFPELGDPGIDVASYDLSLDYDPGTDELRAEAELRLRVVDDLDAVRLDFRGLSVDEAEIDGEAAEARMVDDDAKLEVRRDRPISAGDDLTVRVRYHGRPGPVPTDALGGVEVGWHSGEDGSFVLAEPEGASTWFPVNNHPLDKATYRIDVTVPLPYEAVASGRLVGTEAGDGERTFRWEMDEPMAPYLATVVTGDLEQGRTRQADGVAYTDWVPAGAEELAAAYDGEEEIVAALADKLGPFPFATYGAVVYPISFATGSRRTRSFMAGVALEAQGRSLYAEGVGGPDVIWHETAHQWFGDNVSLTDWSRDIWWIEGFASFAEQIPLLDEEGPDALRDAFAGVYAERRGAPPGDIPRDELFSGRSYGGGSLVFYALLQEVGEQDFWEILRTFQDRYGGGNASTDDLVALAGEVTGQDLRPFFDAWLFDERPPPLP